MVGGVARERGMAMARQLVHRVVAMFLSHYPDLIMSCSERDGLPGMKTTITPKSWRGVLSLPGGWLMPLWRTWGGSMTSTNQENGLVALEAYGYKYPTGFFL
jgi:hypothetical protein